MTDRAKGIAVKLTHDIREDDVEPLMDAIRMLRGVMSVEIVVSKGWEEEISADRERRRLWEEVRDVFYPKKKDGGR